MQESEFVYASYKVAGVVDVEGMVDKLSLYGHVAQVGTSGLRFLPDRTEWPATYFNFDGTIDLVTSQFCLDKLDEYVEVISELLGVDIQQTDHYDA